MVETGATQSGDDSEPIRIDYVLLTVNDVEYDAAKDVFGLNRHVDGIEISYDWGTVDNENHATPIVVALVSLGDKPGSASAALKTKAIIEELAPTHILIIGIVAGISKPRDPLLPGSIFIPRVVHGGTTKDVETRELPVVQPSPNLYDAIWRIEREGDWRKYIPPSIPMISEKNLPCVGTELVSKDNLLPGISNTIFRQVLMDFPNVGAVDMEVGGVAYDLSVAAGSRRANKIPSYLMIKGVSDVVYDTSRLEEERASSRLWMTRKPRGRSLESSIEDDLEQSMAIALARPDRDERSRNQKERDDSKIYAAYASAALSRLFIEKYKMARSPIRYTRMWKNSTPGDIKFFSSSIGIFTGFDHYKYSNLASELLDKYKNDLGNSIHFFTVCAYSPIQLYRMAKIAYKRKIGRSRPDVSQLANLAREEFRHFSQFSYHASQYKKRCARILLVDSNDKWQIGENPRRDEEKLFVALNGDVPCFKLHRGRTGWTRFLTDYVIIGQEILLDYYEDSGILHVGDLIHREDGDYFTRLFDDFVGSYRDEESKFRPFLKCEPWFEPDPENAN